MAGFSRLLIDPNRGEDDPTLIRQLYDGTVVPANYPMATDERERRLDTLLPALSRRGRRGDVVGAPRRPDSRPFLFSVHSFTPVMQGRVRPWHVGILWDLDDRVARLLIDGARRRPGARRRRQRTL